MSVYLCFFNIFWISFSQFSIEYFFLLSFESVWIAILRCAESGKRSLSLNFNGINFCNKSCRASVLKKFWTVGTSPFWRRSALGFLWKEWCWSWRSSTLATSCEEFTHWKRLWCWEGLGAGGEGDDRGWDGWMASLTRWTWVSVNSGSWWGTGRPGVLRFMGSQRVGHDWVNWTELNWTEQISNRFYEIAVSYLQDCVCFFFFFLVA